MAMAAPPLSDDDGRAIHVNKKHLGCSRETMPGLSAHPWNVPIWGVPFPALAVSDDDGRRRSPLMMAAAAQFQPLPAARSGIFFGIEEEARMTDKHG